MPSPPSPVRTACSPPWAAPASSWIHWRETRGLATRAETHVLVRPIARHFPAPVRPVIRMWDRWQAWLIVRFVGMRHQEHKIFWQHQVETLPTREVGSRLDWEPDRPVNQQGTVGVAGWVLPHVAILDRFGLNDRVIARGPVQWRKEADRRMAHDHHPPPGYIDCFRPNLRVESGQIVLLERQEPLTDQQIVDCESRDWN